MIKIESKLKVADNSGAKIVKCIKVYYSNNKNIGYVGSLILVSILKRKHQKKIKKKMIYYGLIISSNAYIKRVDGIFVKFTENRVLIFSKNNKFLGTRIYGPISKEIKIQIYNDINKKQKFFKLISYAKSII